MYSVEETSACGQTWIENLTEIITLNSTYNNPSIEVCHKRSNRNSYYILFYKVNQTTTITNINQY